MGSLGLGPWGISGLEQEELFRGGFCSWGVVDGASERGFHRRERGEWKSTVEQGSLWPVKGEAGG